MQKRIASSHALRYAATYAWAGDSSVSRAAMRLRMACLVSQSSVAGVVSAVMIVVSFPVLWRP